MTEPHTYPLELLRAELKSAMAEQLVQLVDRFASKQELAAFKSEVAAQQKENDSEFSGINYKLDLLLTEKNQRDGATGEQKRLFDRRWVVVTAIIGNIVALTGSAATIVWLVATGGS